MKREIRFSGYGGQGIILMGNITAKAAVLYDSKHAVYTPSYGPEARGGAASSNVILSDEEVDYPYVSNIDVLVAMSQLGYENNVPLLGKKGILIIDKDLVKLKKGEKAAEIEATRIAEGLGKRIVANIVMLGFFTAVADVVSYKAIKKTVLETVPEKFRELNEEALEKGYEEGKKWQE